MPLPSGRGWVYSAPSDTTIKETTKLSFVSETIPDGLMQTLSDDYDNLVEVIFDTCTFGAPADFEDMPVVGNATTLTTLTASTATNLDPGDNDGIPSTWSTAVNIAAIDVSGNGWSAAQVDAFIIALDTVVQAGLGGSAAACTLDISGNTAPTATSSSERSALAGYSPAWTLTTD